jgi:hypothetical protein
LYVLSRHFGDLVLGETLSVRTQKSPLTFVRSVTHIGSLFEEVELAVVVLAEAGKLDPASQAKFSRQAYIFIPQAVNYANQTGMTLVEIISDYFLAVPCYAVGHQYPAAFDVPGDATIQSRFEITERCDRCGTERTSKRQGPNVHHVTAPKYDQSPVYRMAGNPKQLRPTEWKTILAAGLIIIEARELIALHNLRLAPRRQRRAATQ